MSVELDGLFLDLYGTLTDGDRRAVESVCGDIVREHSLDTSAGDFSVLWGDKFFAALETANDDRFKTLLQLEIDTLADVASDMRIDLDPTHYVAALERYWRDPPLQPEAGAFLRDCPVPICIVSNADRADAESALAAHNLRPHELVTSEDARSYKPAPRIFEMALDRTGWRRDCVMHVGDSLHSDVGGAKRAGLRAGWVNRSHRIYDVGTETPDHEFSDLRHLATWLANGRPTA